MIVGLWHLLITLGELQNRNSAASSSAQAIADFYVVQHLLPDLPASHNWLHSK